MASVIDQMALAEALAALLFKDGGGFSQQPSAAIKASEKTKTAKRGSEADEARACWAESLSLGHGLLTALPHLQVQSLIRSSMPARLSSVYGNRLEDQCSRALRASRTAAKW